jgi:cellulose synthase/poly-beta-1,6-N-acetylglucosamine synthase-like glycosyltransferase
MAILSGLEMVDYMRKNSFVDYSAVLSSPLAPSITILAPAYNEGKTIIENVKSLLSIHYTDFEVVIINDGSKDDTLSKIIVHYQLEKVDYLVNNLIQTKPIRGIYKSTNKAYSKLLVIDKENGGKADSLNAGINICNKKYFAAIDVDCVLEEDSILKMIKPFLEDNGNRVIATGGVIGVANSCKIKDGKIVEVNLPESLLARFQVLEYKRSFLMARMAWSRLNALLLISGAFGIFDHEIVVKAGGYDSKTVGEDMELIVRMRRYMIENNLKYRVVYIPDPLCWTEVPEKLRVLARQRNRWTRGTIETLLKHVSVVMNPRYGNLGMLGFPYWIVFEWMAPIIEVFGIIYCTLVMVMGSANWPFFILLLGFTYLFAVVFSSWAVVFEELSFARYRRKRDVVKLILISLIEPFIYHPLTVWFALRGNFHYLIGISSWGKMERKGFSAKKKAN